MVKKAKQKENAKRKKAAAKSPVVRAAVVNKPSKKSRNFDKVYKSPKKSGWQKLVDYLKKRPVLMFLIVFLALGAGFVAFNQYQIYQEKQDFEQAEIVLDELANDIADELGKPLKTDKEKSCGYSSAKFSKGNLGCGISIKSTYTASDLSQNYIKFEELVDTVRNYSKNSDYYNIADRYEFDIENSLDMNCSLTITQSEKALDVSMGCSRPSLSEHFPVVE